jgi:hypothetical protein
VTAALIPVSPDVIRTWISLDVVLAPTDNRAGRKVLISEVTDLETGQRRTAYELATMMSRTGQYLRMTTSGIGERREERIEGRIERWSAWWLPDRDVFRVAKEVDRIGLDQHIVLFQNKHNRRIRRDPGVLAVSPDPNYLCLLKFAL